MGFEALVGLVFALGCRAIPKEAKMELAKPVNCDTAQEDLRILRAEHASVAKMFLEGVTAVAPAGAWRVDPYTIGAVAAFWTIQRVMSFVPQ